MKDGTQMRIAGLFCLLILVLPGGERTAAADELYAAPSADEVRSRTLDWALARDLQDDKLLERIGKL